MRAFKFFMKEITPATPTESGTFMIYAREFTIDGSMIRILTGPYDKPMHEVWVPACNIRSIVAYDDGSPAP